MVAPPSLHWVPAGRVPQLLRYYGMLRLPQARARRLMDSTLGSGAAPRFALLGGKSASQSLARIGSLAADLSHRESCGPLRFLGCPSCAFALLSPDPGRTSAPHPYGASVSPPLPIRRRLQRAIKFRGSITRLQHLLSTLRSTGRPVPRKTRFRSVVNRYREGFEPSGHQRRFQSIITSCWPSSFLKLS